MKADPHFPLVPARESGITGGVPQRDEPPPPRTRRRSSTSSARRIAAAGRGSPSVGSGAPAAAARKRETERGARGGAPRRVSRRRRRSRAARAWRTPRRPGRKAGAAYGRRAYRRRRRPCRRNLVGAAAGRRVRTATGRCAASASPRNIRKSCPCSGRPCGRFRRAHRAVHTLSAPRARTPSPPDVGRARRRGACSWGRRRSPSRSCSTNASGCPTARSPHCCATASG